MIINLFVQGDNLQMKDIKSIIIADTDEHEIKLSNRAVEVNTKFNMNDARKVIKQLKDTIEANNLTSLSAPAIGYDMRIFCIKFKDEIKTFINPILCATEGLMLSEEHCSSIPEKEFIRPRNSKITFMYQRPTGQIETREVAGLTACIVQHELDHLDGILLSDIGLEIDEDFKNCDDTTRSEIVNDYLTSLDIKQKNMNNLVEDDPDAKELRDGIKFMEGVAKGDIKLTPIEEAK